MAAVIRTAYDGVRVGADDLLTAKDAVGAKQADKDACDINNIIRQFSQTGEFRHLNLSSPVFGDTTGLDFHQMMDLVADAQESFAQLPAELRKRFANDARLFVDFCQDPQNKAELERLGLAVTPEAVSALKVPEGPPSVGSPVAPSEQASAVPAKP